jgi:hypothetical protein
MGASLVEVADELRAVGRALDDAADLVGRAASRLFDHSPSRSDEVRRVSVAVRDAADDARDFAREVEETAR